MNIVPYSFNGTLINDGTNYSAFIERANAPGAPGADAKYEKRSGAWPVYVGKDFTPVTYVVKIECLGNAPSQYETLNKLFFTGEETPKQFVVYDDDDLGDKQYYVYATPTGQPTFGNDGFFYTVKLAFDETPIWQASTLTSVDFSVSASTAATTLTIGGNADAYPVIEITPTSTPSTDYRYTQFIQVLPRSDYPWPNRPLDICGDTDATFDTAALVAAGKMQADGDDLRVFDRENEVDRWLSGMNSTDTRVWVNCNMPGKREMTLKTALDASSSTSIQIEDTKANREIMSNLPNTGRLIVDSSLGSTDSEEFTYTQKLITGTRLALVIGERAERNTAAIAHASGSNVRYLKHAYTIVYGNASSTAPDTDDSVKPIIDSTSTNGSFAYSYFVDRDGLRTGAWRYLMFRASAELGQSSIYTTTDAPFGSSSETPATLKYPASVMGSNARTYSKGGVWKGDSISISWFNFFPDGISSLSSSGERYQMQAAWPHYKAKVSTDVNDPGPAASPPHTLWSLLTDVSTNYGAWQTWVKPSSDYTIPTGSRYIAFTHYGSVPGGTSTNVAAVGVKSVMVGLTNPPHVHIRDEAALAHVDFTLYNLTTGEEMAIKIPMLANKKLTIDTNPDCPTAKYAGEIVNGAVKLDTVRPEWFRLPPGDNVIGYETNLAVATDVTITIKWRDRMVYL